MVKQKNCVVIEREISWQKIIVKNLNPENKKCNLYCLKPGRQKGASRIGKFFKIDYVPAFYSTF